MNSFYDSNSINSIYNKVCMLKLKKSMIKESYKNHKTTYLYLQIKELNNRIKYLDDKINHIN